MINIHRIINYPVPSNCYVISHSSLKSCIVIDPGTENNVALLEYLDVNQLNIKEVILTHEHYDHIAGVNDLSIKKSFNLICSKSAAWGIGNSKANFSYYVDGYETYEIKREVSIIGDRETISFGDCEIIIYETPGHSPGSICFNIDQNLFTGDTLLNGTKVPLNLPGSNKANYRTSIEKLKKTFRSEIMIYPGHGEPYFCKL